MGGCATGEAKITGGHGLLARYVIHMVGPVWSGGGDGEPAMRESCSKTSLKIALDHAVRTIAFPAISTGVFGYPKPESAKLDVGNMIFVVN